MQQGGSQYRRLISAFQRVFGATIFFGTDTQREKAIVMHHGRFNFMREARIWYSRDAEQETLPGAFENEVVLSDEFYREILEHPVPADLEAAKALSCSPAALDLFMWLTYRCFTAQGRERVSIFGDFGLANQLGSAEYARPRRFRERLDEWLAIALGDGVDSVLCLGAGLDARPWRLDLPAELRWTEVDFPAMLDYKYGILQDTEPHCRLERKSADLNNARERQEAVAQAAAGARKPLMITEGLLMYLPAETVHALAEEAREAGFRYWIMDSSSPAFMRRAHGDAIEHINRVRAESHLEGPQIRAAVEEHGWKPLERQLFIEEGPKLALQRILEIIQAEGRPPEPPENDGSGIWLYRLEA